MSPIADLEPRIRELGRIRIGQTQHRDGRLVPSRLEVFRLTSRDVGLIERAAELYGGEPRVWRPIASAPDQFEVITETDRLPILVPPAGALSQFYELWSGARCERRCDGVTEQITEQPCMCPAAGLPRAEAAKRGAACRPTSRLNVILPQLPGLGVWRLESHGWYAATELAGVTPLLEAATAAGTRVPAVLRIEIRTGPGRHFAVPVLDVEVPIGASVALGGAPAPMALPSGPSVTGEGAADPIAPAEWETSAGAPPSSAAMVPEEISGQPSSSGSETAVEDPYPADSTPPPAADAVGGLPDREASAGGSVRSPEPPANLEGQRDRVRVLYRTEAAALRAARRDGSEVRRFDDLSSDQLAALILAKGAA